jgi:hypothetical protein
MVDLTGKTGVTLIDLTLDAAHNPFTNQGVFASNASKLRIQRVTVRDIVGPGIRVGIHFTGENPTKRRGVTDSVIADCRFQNMATDSEWGGGIRLSWGSSRNRVLRNTIRDTGRGGIFGDNGSCDLTLRGNRVSGSGGEGLGLEIWGDCDRCVVEDNRLDHWLSIGGCKQCAVRRNTIGAWTTDVKFLGLEAIGSDQVITDNVVDGGQQIGLSVSNNYPNDRVFWGYNRVSRCVQWGAQLQGDRTGVHNHYFFRCRFESNGDPAHKPIYPSDLGHGFRVNQNASGLVLNACDFINNRGHGIQVNGSGDAPSDNLLFVDCRISGNRGSAASFWPGYTRLAWQRCSVFGNGSNALPPPRGEETAQIRDRISSPAAARVGQPVALAIRTPPGSGGPPAAVLWDLGDGIPKTSRTVKHTYSAPGRYRVTLVTWDTRGTASHDERIVTVLPASPAATSQQRRKLR